MLKNANTLKGKRRLLCCAANRTAQCISIYASRFGFLRALHLTIFEQPQSKLWKHIPQQAAGYYTLLIQDNSTNKLQCASLLKFESHYPPLRGIAQLTNSSTSQMTFRLLRFRNWSFTNKYNSSLTTRNTAHFFF
jgi:hypothetical protein